MAGRLAILAGAGQLPVLIQSAHPDALAVTFDGMPHGLTGPVSQHHFERLGHLFDALRAADVDRVVMVGAMQRPRFDPERLDAFTAALLPKLGQAMAQGDDHVLRFLIAMFQDQGFDVVGAHQVLAGLTCSTGPLCGVMDDTQQANIARADHVLAQLSVCDLGQAVVAEGGQILGIETLQGTAFLLGCVAATDASLRHDLGGVLVKRPKAGQDLRVDMPAIGPDTVDQVADAGLSGIVISPDSVMVIDRDTVIARAAERGVFILAQAPTC